MTNPFSPQQPPRLHVEPLPTGALAAAAERLTHDNGQPVLDISVWLPNEWATNEARDRNGRRVHIGATHIGATRRVPSEDATEEAFACFERDVCFNCRYYCTDRDLDWDDVDDMEWNDGDGNYWRLSGATADSPCPCHRDGIDEVNWPCTAGHDEPDPSDYEDEDEDEDEDGEDTGETINDGLLHLGPTRFTTRRYLSGACYTYLGLPQRYEFTAHLQKLSITGDAFSVAYTRRMANTFDPNQTVCWGNGNTVPQSLEEAAAAYAQANANDDLLNVHTAAHNCRLAAEDPTPYELNKLAIALPPTADEERLALVVADAATMPDAFLLLAASGATTGDGLAIAAAQWVNALPLPNGQQFTGWATAPLAGGCSWLIGQTAATGTTAARFVLLGQHNLQSPTPSPLPIPCDSHALSSSAAAAPADTSSLPLPVC
jgi:hypothetical protein